MKYDYLENKYYYNVVKRYLVLKFVFTQILASDFGKVFIYIKTLEKLTHLKNMKCSLLMDYNIKYL